MTKLILEGGDIDKIKFFVTKDKWYEITIKEIGDTDLKEEDYQEIVSQIEKACKESEREQK